MLSPPNTALSYRGSSPVSSHRRAPCGSEFAARWIPGMNPGMTSCVGSSLTLDPTYGHGYEEAA